MRDLEKLCNQLEKMDKSSFNKYIAEKYGNALRALTKVTDGDVKKASAVLTVCAMSAAHVDGKFTQSEYAQVGALIDATNGEGSDVSFEEAKAMTEKLVTGKNSNEELVEAVYISIAKVDMEAAAEFVFFLIAICCADGDASWKERSWLKKIYK